MVTFDRSDRSADLQNALQDPADIVIADFTLGAKNVYFEAGYARAAQKQIIQTSRDKVLEFDVRNWRTTFYRNATELEAKFVPELQAAYSQLESK